MFSFDQNTLVVVLSEHEGVELVSYGKPRDGFELTTLVPHWTSGFGGKYEIIHKNVPPGVMIAVGDADSIDVENPEKLKERLKSIDIYPAGHSGDFTGKDIAEIKKWFFDRSVRDDSVNDQSAMANVKKLTPEGLGKARFDELVDYLAEEMNLFKDPKQGNKLVPETKSERVEIVKNILDGLAKSVRYTRLDAPAQGYQLKSAIDITKQGKGTLSFLLEDVHKIIVLRKAPETGEVSVTPLDKSMLGKTYVTKDGQPLGDRGMVDIETIVKKAQEIEATKKAPKQDTVKNIIAGGPGNSSSGLPNL